MDKIEVKVPKIKNQGKILRKKIRYVVNKED